MSAFRPSGGGGGIDPAQLAALVDDGEAGALLASALASINDARAELAGRILTDGQSTRNVDLTTRMQVLDALSDSTDTLASQAASVRAELLTEIPSIVTSRTQEVMNLGNSNRTILEQRIAAAGMPVGFVAEFPANAVPAGWEVIQGAPAELPVGFGTVSASRTTGNGTSHRGFARTLATNRIWSLYTSTLAALDLTLNKVDAVTYTLPVAPSTGFFCAVLHDLTDSKALITLGANTAGTLGDNRAYTFDANSKVFTQVANFQLTGTDGNARAGLGGSSLRLADGRLFWLPYETWRTASTATVHSNLSTANGGYYFIYDPVINVVTSQRFSNWAAALTTDLAYGANTQGLHGSLPIGQLPDGRLIMQELAATVSASRYFILDLAANTVTLGTGAWTGGQWALASHPQGLVAFVPGSTARRYYNASTNSMDAANATTFSSASVSGSNTGLGYKALPFGGNYALPANNGTTDALALAYDGFTRLGTVKARKTA